MIRYISLLLFIGLAWGQEYDPETGEVVKKQYDPETRKLIKDQNDTAEIEIWNKKIPPSVYFEKLSNDLERPSRLSSCFTSYLIFGFGLLFFQSSADSNMSESMRQFGNGMGTLGIAAGLYYASRILRIGPKGLKWIPKTDEGKQFENIKNIQDKNEKEKLAYESLVALATTSRIHRNKLDEEEVEEEEESYEVGLVFILLTALVSTAIEENKNNKPEQNIQIQMTIEEKTLDNYLNHIPI